MSQKTEFGTRLQTGAARLELRDAKNDQSSLWSSTPRGRAAGKPFSARWQAWRAGKDIDALAQEVASYERAHGRVLRPEGEIDSDIWLRLALQNSDQYKALKIATLIRTGRDAGTITERLVHSAGNVIDPTTSDKISFGGEQLFVQHWAPTVDPTGTVVVFVPGYSLTGRLFHDHADFVTSRGHDAFLADMHWAGNGTTANGHVPRGFEIALRTASLVADAKQFAEAKYGPNGKVVVVGESLGGGPGALSATTLNDNGLLELDLNYFEKLTPQMPQGVDSVLLDPFLGPTNNTVNTLLRAIAAVPRLRDIPLPYLGFPIFARDNVGAQRLAQNAIIEGVKLRPSAIANTQKDVQAVRRMIREGHVPKGRVSIVHASDDSVNSHAAVQETVEDLRRANVDVEMLSPATKDHVLEVTPGFQDWGKEAIRTVTDE